MNVQKCSNAYLKSLIIIINICILFLFLLNFKKSLVLLNHSTNGMFINYSNLSYNFNDSLFFNLSSIKYYFSYKFNKTELEYDFYFFDKQNNLL